MSEGGNQERIVFRVDASFAIGSGHVERCLTLAQELKKLKTKPLFVIAEPEESLKTRIEASGFKVYSIPRVLTPLKLMPGEGKIDAENTRAVLTQAKAKWLIVDHYSLDKEWESIMRNSCEKLMVIDDLANRPHDCDLLIDQNDSASLRETYRKLVPPGCELLLGPEHALLRYEFVQARRTTHRVRTKADRILVFYGAADASGETEKALAALAQIGVGREIHIVIGRFNQRADEIKKMAATLKQKVSIYSSISNMAALMNSCDLSLGAGGTTSWERSFVGLPSLITILADNQRAVAEALATRGASLSLGWWKDVSVEKISQALTKLNSSTSELKKLSEKSYAIWQEDPDPAKELAGKMGSD